MSIHTPSISLGRHAGFTLVELMITVVILAILVSIAVPSYTAQVRKSRRTDARNAILDIAAREERFLSVSNAYSKLATDVGYGGAFPQTLLNNYYIVDVAVPDPAYVGTSPSYKVTATATGIQASDAACATLTVNQLGQQASTGTVNNDPACWGN